MGWLTDVGLPLCLAFIMFSLGIGLVADDFARIATQPRGFVAGILSQVVLLPLVGLLLISVWPLQPELALGVMIIACAPGGVTSNILTAFGKGDVALSISLTAVTSLLALVTVPLIVNVSTVRLLGEAASADVSIVGIAFQVFLMVTLPVLLGMTVRRLAEHTALRLDPYFRRIAGVLFLLVLAGAILKEKENVIGYFAQAGAVTLMLNVVMMIIAWYIAATFAADRKQRIAIAVECGLQNGTLALAVATALFDGGLVVVPTVTYSLIMFVTALLFIGRLRRQPEEVPL